VVSNAQSSPVPDGDTGVGEPNGHTSKIPNTTAENLALDATVQGFEESLTVKNADGSGKVVVLNDNLPVPNAAETNRSQPAHPDGTTPQDALRATDPIDAHRLSLVPRRSA
jgi:hypothetical protein